MGEFGKKAGELFDLGYNCAQSVLGAFSEKFGMDFDTLIKLSSSFGGGVAGRREMCGAVSSMLMVIGLGCGYSDSAATDEKQAHYKRCRDAMDEFEKELGSVVCAELLKKHAGTAHGRPCRRFCELAADIAAEKIDG